MCDENIRSEKIKGACYGVSVGPGDPLQITSEALSVIEKCDVIFLPSAPKEECMAYIILKNIMPDIDDKDISYVDGEGKAGVGMDKRHQIMADKTAALLDEGKNVCYPTLGDVSIYSTYSYIHEKLTEKGYVSRMVSGISSVQAVCAKLGIVLAKAKEEVHIFPNSDDLDKKLKTAGTLVFMKPKKDLKTMTNMIADFVKSHEGASAGGVSNCGLPDEAVAENVDKLGDLTGYYTVIIVKSPGDTECKKLEGSEIYEASASYFENRACKWYPCHASDHINCLFCYCPMYRLEHCPGSPEYLKRKDGVVIKVCTNCTFPHEKDHYDIVMNVLKNANAVSPGKH